MQYLLLYLWLNALRHKTQYSQSQLLVKQSKIICVAAVVPVLSYNKYSLKGIQFKHINKVKQFNKSWFQWPELDTVQKILYKGIEVNVDRRGTWSRVRTEQQLRGEESWLQYSTVFLRFHWLSFSLLLYFIHVAPFPH